MVLHPHSHTRPMGVGSEQGVIVQVPVKTTNWEVFFLVAKNDLSGEVPHSTSGNHNSEEGTIFEKL